MLKLSMISTGNQNTGIMYRILICKLIWIRRVPSCGIKTSCSLVEIYKRFGGKILIVYKEFPQKIIQKFKIE
jgi:hypothetical protein